jgi:hypothetical protein
MLVHFGCPQNPPGAMRCVVLRQLTHARSVSADRENDLRPVSYAPIPSAAFRHHILVKRDVHSKALRQDQRATQLPAIAQLQRQDIAAFIITAQVLTRPNLIQVDAGVQQ